MNTTKTEKSIVGASGGLIAGGILEMLLGIHPLASVAVGLLLALTAIFIPWPQDIDDRIARQFAAAKEAGALFLFAVISCVILILLLFRIFGGRGEETLAAGQVINTQSEQVTLPPIAPEFATAYQKHSAKLGPQTQDVRPAGLASVAFHEQGTLIWFVDSATIYRLKKKEGSWDKRPHEIEPNFEDSDWRNEDFIREKLGIPNDKEVPWSGVAFEWDLDPSDWEWLGGRLWQCTLDGSATFMQEFEKGMLLGPIPAGPELKRSRIVALLNDDNHTYESAGLPEPAHEITCR